MSFQVSEGARQLYEYMKARHVVCKGKREHEVFGIFDGGSLGFRDFSERYNAYLIELFKAKVIRILNKDEGIYILSRAKLQPFIDLEKSQQTTESLTGRYQPDHQLQLEGLFRSFALQRKSGKFSGKAIFKELEYYSNFTVKVVMASIGRYLHHSAKHGPSYFRGVLRGVDKERVDLRPVVAVKVTPASEYEEKRKKAEWIRSRIDQSVFTTMTPKEQEGLLSNLEQDYANRNSQEAP